MKTIKNQESPLNLVPIRFSDTDLSLLLGR